MNSLFFQHGFLIGWMRQRFEGLRLSQIQCITAGTCDGFSSLSRVSVMFSRHVYHLFAFLSAPDGEIRL